MKATLKNFRQPPRKVLLVTKTLRGKQAVHALTTLRLIDKKISEPLRKLITSAINNAKQTGKENTKDLKIENIKVDQGTMLKRYRPRAFGRATPIRRRTSTIHVELQ